MFARNSRDVVILAEVGQEDERSDREAIVFLSCTTTKAFGFLCSSFDPEARHLGAVSPDVFGEASLLRKAKWTSINKNALNANSVVDAPCN